MQRLPNYIKQHIVKMSRSEKKVLRRRGLSLVLAFLLLTSVMEPLFGLFVSETKAEEIYYNGNTLDGSKGSADITWFTEDGGTAEAPYLIKNADALAGLAQLVNEGNSFENKHICLLGLTEEEAAQLRQGGNSDAQAGVIDLRQYNGGTGDTTQLSYWIPIGKDAAHPFKGTLYSDSGNTVSIINMNAFTDDANLKSYGLVGYNAGTVRDFSISYTKYARDSSIKTGLDFSVSKASSLEYLGSAVAYNTADGIVENITVGIGGQTYEAADTFSFDKNAVIDTNILINKTFLSLGGVVGASLGNIKACSFYGTITTTNENNINSNEDVNGGVGGIAGYAGQPIQQTTEAGKNIMLESCVAKVDIQVNMVGQNCAYGGIVGKTSGFGEIRRCVSYGNLKAENAGINENANANKNTKINNQFGGIGGRLASGEAVAMCISAMNITVDRNSQRNFEPNNNTKAPAVVGGIAGALINSPMNQCFSLGRLSGKTIVGGLVGLLVNSGSTPINSCYSTAAVTIASNGTDPVGSITDYESAGIHAAGGLIGFVGTQTAVIQNSYFAGSTLKSEAGSIYGGVASDAAFSAAATVFYDKQVSPNRGAGANRSAGIDTATYGKTTTGLKETDIEGFSKNGTSYPMLTWVENGTAAAVSANVGNLARAFSAISTACYINETNTYGNAYQAKAVGTSGDTPLIVPNNSDNITYQEWVAESEYKGVQKAETLGGVYRLDAEVTGLVGGKITVCVTRKILLPVNPSASDAMTADQIPDIDSFHRFLDIANLASGAYIGGEFTLSENLGAVDVAPVPYSIDNRMMDNLFCAALNGNNKTISKIGFSSVSSGLFGAALSGVIQDLTVTAIALGTEAAPYDFSGYQYQYAGMLCSRAKATTFKNITFSDVSIVLNNSQNLLKGFGLLTGYNAPGGTYTVNSMVQAIGATAATVSIPVLGNSLSMGLFGGILNNTEISDSSIDEIVFTTTTGTVYDLGSFVGSMAGNGEVKNCQVKMLTASISGSATASNQKGFGGFGSSIGVNVTNCAVSGTINGKLSAVDASRNCAAGISVFGSNTKTFQNCTFNGSITGFGYVGGIVAYSNYGFAIKNSNVYGTLENNELENSVAGGLIGYASYNATITDSYYFGNIAGSFAGGLIGQGYNSGSITVAVKNSYAKAIIKGITTGTYIGGLIGQMNAKNVVMLTMENCYFAGQLRGNGFQGGIAGYVPSEKLTLKNTYFDKSIAGATVATVASISANDNESSHPGADLDAKCAITSSEITKAALGNSASFQEKTETNYPAFATAPGAPLISENDKLNDLSTRKVFLMRDYEGNPGYLTSLPSFKVDENNSEIAITVDDAKKETVILKDGVYIPKNPGYTTATVTNTLPGGGTLQMVYDVVFVPFEKGVGTESDPYIIFDANELKKFKEFVDGGFDTENTWYKIGDKNTEAAITINLQDDVFGGAASDWEPIRNFKGHLEGNNSVLANLTQKAPWTDKENASDIGYIGLFATASGDIKNLTLNHVELGNDASDGTIYVGALVAYATGGNFIGCHVLNDTAASSDSTSRRPNQIRGKNAAAVGGLIGFITIGPNAASNVQGCTVLADINYSGTVANGTGGVVGYVNLSSLSTSILNVDKTASYGAANVNQTSLGGIIGGISSLFCDANFTNNVSTMDLTVKNQKSLLGGILAGKDGSAERGNTPATVAFENCYYGGKLSYPNNIKMVGGITADIYLYQDLRTLGKGNVNQGDFSSKNLIVPGGLYDSMEELGQEVDKMYTQNGIFKNCAYNYNINHVPVATVTMRCTFTLNNKVDAATFVDVPYTTFMDVATARSSTQEMTDASKHTSDDNFNWSQGYYPIPTRLSGAIDNPNTAQNEAYMGFMARFYSTPVYYTNADKFGDNTYSNIYLLTEPAEGIGGETLNTDGLKDSQNVIVTSNGKMVQSIATASGTNSITVPLTGQYNNVYTFTKDIVFLPSVVACGVSDSSFVYANPGGMWVTGDNGTKYPWTIYTADQLQGLTAVVNNVKDGNGITAGATAYNSVLLPPDIASLPDGTEARKGDTFVLGRDIDCAAYTVFDPICPDGFIVENGIDQSKAFDSQLNGLGHVITNLNITRAVNRGEIIPSYTKLGLFGQASGAELKNFGLVNLNEKGGNPTGGVFFDKDTTSVGSIAASLENSRIENCFSAVPVMGQGTENQTAGGLVGNAGGSNNTIIGSFYTGVLHAQSSEGDTDNIGPALGGILGDSGTSNTTVSNSYVAGFLQTTGSMAVIAPKGSVSVNGCYYDLNATGDMKINNNAAVTDLSKEQPTGFQPAVSGFYPLQSVYSTNSNTKALNAATVKIYLTNARSATGGSVTASGFTIARVSSYNGVASLGDINLEAGGTTFSQNNSGFLFLKAGRLVAAELKCWYNDGKNDGKTTVYTINTAKELLEFSMIVNGTLTAANNPNGNHEHGTTDKTEVPFDFKNCIVRLGSDIDLSDLPEGFAWEAIGDSTSGKSFQGTFDGNGYVITLNSNAAGLFDTIEGANIQNLGLNGTVDAAGKSAVAPLAQLASNSNITACFSAVNINNAVSAAGLVGELSEKSTLENSYNMGSISGNGTLAGLVRNNSGTVTNCYNTGVVSSFGENAMNSGSAAGIALDNLNGTIQNCFNAAYVSAAEFYAIANGGTTGPECVYDPQLMETPQDADGLSKDFSSGFDKNGWQKATDTFYPRLTVFTDGNSSSAFQTASGLSALMIRFNGKNYQEFTSASLFGLVNGVSVQLNPAQYTMSMLDNEFTISNPNGATGVQTVTASAAGFSHGYYTIAQATMKIRYKFDFSALFAGTPHPNDNYHKTNETAQDEWIENPADGIFKISTEADFNHFVSYVNKGGVTDGKTFQLNYDIDFGSKALTPVTGKFNGTFDGGYYTLTNFTITGNGQAALFAEIGEAGRVENLAVSNANVTVNLKSGAAETVGGVIAADNKGYMGNIALTDCSLRVNNNATTSANSYVGVLAAKNNGRIAGCYFKNQGTDYALSADGTQPDFSGSLVGHNRGTLSGCYFIGRTSQIYLITGGNEGEIYNCYYAANSGLEPEFAKGAYRQINADGTVALVERNNYWLTHEQMQTPEFATWLSSNIYGGAFEVGSSEEFTGGSGGDLLNGGFPYLAGYELVKYDLTSYFADKTTMLLSVWNTSDDETQSSISNGVFALDNLRFKYFSDIIMKAKLEFNMHELPNGIDYLVSNARVYASDAQYKNYALAGTEDEKNKILNDFKGDEANGWNSPLTANSGSWAKTISNANLVVVTIKFRGSAADTPWGNYRTWSSTTGIESSSAS